MNYSAFAAAASSTSTFVGTLPPANGVGSVETRVTPSFLRPLAKSPSCFGRSLVCDQGFNLRSWRIPGFATKGQHTVCAPFATATTEKSVHNFTVKDIDGNDIFLSKFKGKVLLIVNVASKCGFTTSNYTELSHLYDVYKNQGFEVLAFPCNQFGGQEPGSNPEIKRFACTKFKAEFSIFDKVGLGCTIQNHVGELIAASGYGVSSRSVNMAELRTALLGLTLAKDLMDGILGVILEGDSAYACSTLNRILTGFHEGTIEYSLAKAMKDCPRLVVVQIDRRASSEANYVANIACARDFVGERGMPLTQALSFILSQDFVPMLM